MYVVIPVHQHVPLPSLSTEPQNRTRAHLPWTPSCISNSLPCSLVCIARMQDTPPPYSTHTSSPVRDNLSSWPASLADREDGLCCIAAVPTPRLLT